MKSTITMPYKELSDPGAEDLIKAIEENPKVKVYTSSTVEKISGGPVSIPLTSSQMEMGPVKG